MKFKLLLFLSVLWSLSAIAQDEIKPTQRPMQSTGLLYGFGLSVSQEIYKGYNNRTIPLPLIGYRGENLTVFGPFVSYQVQDFDHVKVSVKLSPRFQGFDEGDSNVFIGMQERKNSIDIGIGVNYENNDWKLGLTSMFDSLNRSGGYELKTDVSRVYRVGPFFIEPSLSLSFLDSHHIDYYYGVRASEITSQRGAYVGNSAINKTIGLSISTPLFFNGFTRMSIDYTHFDSEITDSPLVKENSSFRFGLFFTKNF